jgi:hypothetical protein
MSKIVSIFSPLPEKKRREEGKIPEDALEFSPPPGESVIATREYKNSTLV